MKNKVLILTMVFVLMFSTIITASSINDVPTDHWAYESVEDLVDRGLLQLYDDGTFRGNESISRFQLAEIISRILEEIEGGGVEASSEDMELLRTLSVEFQEELVDLAISGEAFTEQLDELRDKNLSQDEDISEIIAVDIPYLEDEINNLVEQIGDVESDVSQIIENLLKIRELEEKVKLLENTNEEHYALIMTNQEDIQELKELNIQVTDETLESLENKLSVNTTRLNSLQMEFDDLKSEVELKDNTIQELEEDKNNYKTYLYGVAGISLILLLLSN